MRNNTHPGLFDLNIAITWLIRLITGSVFIFSGFVKAIDPWGTLYKLIDYMGAMHIPVFRNLLIVLTFALCAYEFVVGVFLFLGCFRKSAPVFAALLMAVMLPLTLWIAIANPVEDCGCFGDALVIGNWTTFWKNVVLCLLIAWLIKYNTICRSLISAPIQWIGLLLTAGYCIAISVIGYIYQPLLDFRPYHIGTSLVDISDDTAEESESDDIRFIYAKNGVEESFSIYDELPDEESGWVFVRRETESQNVSAEKPSDKDNEENGTSESLSEKNLRIWADGGNTDVTDEVFEDNSPRIILLMPDLKDVSIATTWQINSMYTWSREHDIDFIGIVNGSEEDIANWRDLSLAEYPIYTADDTQIKMVARGNPAVVYTKDNEIIWKSTLRALGMNDFQSADAYGNAESFTRNDKAILYNITGFYLIMLTILITASFIPYRSLFKLNISKTPINKK